MVQTCIVHLIRNSLAFVSWQDRKAMVSRPEADLPRRDGGAGIWNGWMRSSRWGRQYPTIAPSLAPGVGIRDSVVRFPAGIRKMIYTTNAVESLNRSCARSSRPAAASRPMTRR